MKYSFFYLKDLATRSVQAFLRDNAMQMAAAISYYVLFSLFPLLIFIVGVFGVFLRDEGLQEDVIDLVVDNIPLTEDEGRDEVREAVEGVAGAAGGALGVLGLLGMAWSGSAMFGVIRRSLNAAFEVEQPRPVVMQKLLDLGLVLALGFFFLVSIFATGFLRVVEDQTTAIPIFGRLAEDLGVFWVVSSHLVPLAFSFLAFLFLYSVVPAQRPSPRHIWPGALLAAVLFEIVKNGFSFYVANFAAYDVVFGSLGAVVAFLFWVYLSANIMLLGAEVASQVPHVKVEMHKQPKLEGLEPPLTRRVWKGVRGLFVHEK
jgi:membrane protein